MTEALKTGNIKTVLSILRTIDEERKLEYRRCRFAYIVNLKH